MYNNIGERIKSVAIILTVLEGIATIIAGIWMIVEFEIFGFFVLLAGLLFTCLTYLILFGFGELISKQCEQVEEQKKSTAVLNSILRELRREAPKAEAVPVKAPAPAPEPTPVQKPEPAVVPVQAEQYEVRPKVAASVGYGKTCPNCGFNQPATRKTCMKCGFHFDAEL